MVARILAKAGLCITITRDEEEIDVRIVATGEEALRAAIHMLSRLEFLQVHDKLTVTEV